jgi:hypothetical protein
MAELEDVVRSIMERLGPQAPLSKILKECRLEVMADPELQEAVIIQALTDIIEAEKAGKREKAQE